ncbi:hypothetical protein QP365_09070 [Corynebacterium aurimucosum]|nr:hypothetical protein [Corynebacterium aurimucosum]NJJ83729.1 hypothetical protein [Corynebacterium aurimucosum]
MPWFKVDDGFYDHPKVLELDMAARGLWVMAGAYCARHLTDGVITGRQIKVIGGTQKQAEKLVAAGLWSADDAPPSARRYVFNDWREFQPTRDDVLSKRREDAERKRLARGVKRDKQQERKNVRADVQPDSEAPSALPGLRAPSALPGPARPDPSPSGGTGSQPSNGDLGAGDMAGGISLDELAAATRRARQAGISETAITTGTRNFNQRQEPKGPGLLRTLIDEAWADEQDTNRAETAAQARRHAIDACDLCDDNGMRYQDGEAWRCDHNPETRPNRGPAAPQSNKQHIDGQSPQTTTPKPHKRKEAPF